MHSRAQTCIYIWKTWNLWTLAHLTNKWLSILLFRSFTLSFSLSPQHIFTHFQIATLFTHTQIPISRVSHTQLANCCFFFDSTAHSFTRIRFLQCFVCVCVSVQATNYSKIWSNNWARINSTACNLTVKIQLSENLAKNVHEVNSNVFM